MTERKFTPPTEFPAEYVDGYGNKVTLLGRSNHGCYPLIGHDKGGWAGSWTEKGEHYVDIGLGLHDIPKRITSWHNVYKSHISVSYASRSEADKFAATLRLCVYRIERDEDGGNPEIFVEEV